MKTVVEGLQILLKYFPDGDIAAEHDVIYAGGDNDDVSISDEDMKRLEELRWHYDESLPSWFHYV